MTPGSFPVYTPPAPGPASDAFARRLLGRLGWTIVGQLPDVPAMVCVVAPHTSNWDFVVGILVAFALGVRRRWHFRFLAKQSLFTWPIGPVLRLLGGVPVDRSARRDVVGEVGRNLKRDRFLMAVTPEATRRRAEYWKTGFYYIALETGAPMVPVALDWGQKQFRFGEPIVASGDLPADIGRFRAFYAGVLGKRPEMFGEIRVRERES